MCLSGELTRKPTQMKFTAFRLFPNVPTALEQIRSLEMSVTAELLHIYLYSSLLQNNVLPHLPQSLSDYYFCLSKNLKNIIFQNIVCGFKV